MARKTKEDMLRTREVILSSALDLFYKNGFSRTTLDQIASKSNCTRGAIYWHFKNKIEIFIKLSEKFENIIAERFANIVETENNEINDLKKFCQEFISILEKNKDFRRFYNMVLRKTEWTDELRYVEKILIENDKHTQKFFELKFQAIANRNNLLPAITPKLASVGLLSYFFGLISWWLIDQNECSTQDMFKLVDIYIDSLIID
ncbi:TetR family transcriptional regulator [Lentisphaerota bacterium WC36G]|nr:TetR family transcriptional regulator [Lentisphaerae bacterium WC36]